MGFAAREERKGRIYIAAKGQDKNASSLGVSVISLFNLFDYNKETEKLIL